MAFKLPEYIYPDFTCSVFEKSEDVRCEAAECDGVVPFNYHATSIYPEYFKMNGKWILAGEGRMDCVVIYINETFHVKEFRNIKKGDMVVVGRTDDGSEGIFVDYESFRKKLHSTEPFAFRTGRTRETSYSKDYDILCNLLEHEKENGFIIWVLGPAVVFDHYSRNSMSNLIRDGYVDAIFAGNALATHDLEAAVFGTALGQHIYSQELNDNGHYHHIDIINKVRSAGSVEKFVEQENIKDGVIKACIDMDIPFILAGSIRDDGPLPCVIGDVYKAQDAMREYTKKATTVVAMATMLHTIATGNMTPSYKVMEDGSIRPVFIFAVDASEFVVDKLKDRGSLTVTSIVTNVQDFVVNVDNDLKAKNRIMK